MSMVDGLPYKEEVGGSSPSAPTSLRSQISDLKFEIDFNAESLARLLFEFEEQPLLLLDSQS